MSLKTVRWAQAGRLSPLQPTLPAAGTAGPPPSSTSSLRQLERNSTATLTQLRFGDVETPAQGVLNVVERDALRQDVLQQHAQQERQHLRSPATWAAWQRAHVRFSQFLQMYMGDSEQGWQVCQPCDILVYFYRFLPGQHTGRTAGQLAAQTVKGLMSNISQCMEMRGRCGPWDPEQQHGNPVLSSEVQRAVQAYGNELSQQGVRERSAAPVHEAKLRLLIERLEDDIEQQVGSLQQPLHKQFPRRLRCDLRDSAHLKVMWHSLRRGGDLHRLDWTEVYMQTEDGSIQPVQQAWVAENAAPPLQGTLLLVPRCSKTEHGKRVQTQEVASQSDPLLCGVSALYRLYQWELSAAQATKLEGPVFKTSTGSRMQSSAACNRVRILLQRYGLDEGETMHGIRRGSIQRQQNRPAHEVMRQAGMRSFENYLKYNDPGRHLH